MMDNRYREELDGIRLTVESKRALAQALAARQGSNTTRRWSRTAIAAAVIVAMLAGSVGAAVVLPPVVRNYFGDSAGYRQGAVELGQSITQNGWTLTLTDCLADDYTIYLGVTLTAPDGTVLDQEGGYYFSDWGGPDFPELKYGAAGTYTQLEDGNPTDNQLSFLFTSYYLPREGSLNGQTMEITLGGSITTPAGMAGQPIPMRKSTIVVRPGPSAPPCTTPTTSSGWNRMCPFTR